MDKTPINVPKTYNIYEERRKRITILKSIYKKLRNYIDILRILSKPN